MPSPSRSEENPRFVGGFLYPQLMADPKASIERVKDRIALQKARINYEVTGNLAETARQTGQSYETLRDWHSKGLLDPDNEEIILAQIRTLGPELIEEIVTLSGSLVVAAQRRVAEKIHTASARDASRIAVEQHNIFQLARGEATSRHEFVTGEEVASRLHRISGGQPQVYEGEAEEITDAVSQ